MPGPAVGTIEQGYRFMGGDPSNPSAWQPVGSGFDSSSEGKKYQGKLAFERAKMDADKLRLASDAEREGYSKDEAARANMGLLKQDIPLGGFAEGRMWASKNLPFMRGALGVPTEDQLANMQSIQRAGNEGTLGNVGQLKGPLSDRDVVFLKTLQYDVNSPRQTNMRVAMAEQWAAKRQAAYASALRKWTEILGSPSALNKEGISFDRWWGQYSEQALPRPTFGKQELNGALKQKSAKAQSSKAEILSVRPD